MALLLMILWAIGGVHAQNAEIQDMREQAGTLRKDIAEKEKILMSSKKDVKSKLANLDIVTAKVNDRKKLINIINSEIRLVNREITKLTREMNTLQNNVDKSRKEYAEALRRARKYGSFNNKLMFIFSGDGFNTMLRRYRYVREYMYAHVELADSLKVQIMNLEKKKDELETSRAAKKVSLKGLETERAELQKLEKEQRTIVKELQREHKKVEKELKKKRDELNRLNKAIEREIERVLEAERKAKMTADKKKESSSKSELSEKENSGVAAMTGSFESNKKKLPMPITGSYLLVERYGVKNAISGKGNVPINSGGITLEGNKGAKARCIFDGKITAVFGSGNYAFVLVRHGKYISVYCNLENIRVKAGSDIKAGDIIGDIAVDAKGGNPRMLFQLRLEKQTLNPELWLKM